MQASIDPKYVLSSQELLYLLNLRNVQPKCYGPFKLGFKPNLSEQIEQCVIIHGDFII